MTTRKAPLVIEVDEAALPDAPSPAEAPQPVEAPAAAERAVLMAARPGGGGLGRLFLGLLGAFVLLWASVAATDFVIGLFARGGWLGWAGAGLLVLLVAVLVLMCLREVAALARLGRIARLKAQAEDAAETGSAGAVDATMAGLQRLYGSRRDLDWAWAELAKAQGDGPDPQARLALAERMLMSPLDRQAEAAVMRASRNVAAATALIPLALADVLAALTCNLRMVREISEIYGGRAGWFGSWRLMKAVAAHLVATGAVAVADDLLGPLLGGGVLAKLSRRFGEGAVNGALTARVGVSAIQICRPLPFAELDPPKASGLVLAALKDWRREG